VVKSEQAQDRTGSVKAAAGAAAPGGGEREEPARQRKEKSSETHGKTAQARERVERTGEA